MKNKLKTFNYTDKELFKKASHIRDVVFVVEQKVEKEIEFDGLDQNARHYLLFDGDKAIATGRWRETEKGIKLERFAVLKEYRKSGAGKEILKNMLDEVRPHNKKIYLNAQVSAIGFYSKYGFGKVGEIFEEANIEHYTMYYRENSQF